MNVQELRKLTIDELNDKLADVRKKLNELKFDLKIGKSSDYASIRFLKKDIARIWGVIGEKKLGDDFDKKEVK